MLTHADRREWLTVKETAARLRLYPMTVRRMIAHGRIPAVQLGGPRTAICVSAGELDEWIGGRRTAVGGSFAESASAMGRSSDVPAERSETSRVARQSSSRAHAGPKGDV
jgi:excisionase family DNA binding protein